VEKRLLPILGDGCQSSNPLMGPLVGFWVSTNGRIGVSAEDKIRSPHLTHTQTLHGGAWTCEVGLCHEQWHRHRILPTIVARIVRNSGKKLQIVFCCQGRCLSPILASYSGPRPRWALGPGRAILARWS